MVDIVTMCDESYGKCASSPMRDPQSAGRGAQFYSCALSYRRLLITATTLPSQLVLYFALGVVLVGLDYHLNEPMAHDVFLVEVDKLNAGEPPDYALGLDQTRAPA